jgi:2-polyprenyl-3-methyl-5-hydroxy-6-metoxy-1,4-benzoquinol methylase
MAFHAAEEILRSVGPGRILHIGCTDSGLVQALLRRGADACGVSTGGREWRGYGEHLAGRIHHGSLASLPFTAGFDTVVVDGNLLLDATDGAALLATLRPLTRHALVLWTAGRHDELLTRGERSQREYWDNAAIAAGYRRHPRELNVAGYLQRNDPALPEFSYYEPLDAHALREWPLDRILATRDLHMDMSRETGCRADAHLVRYSLAAEWVRPGDTVLDCACGLGYGSAILAARSRGGRFLAVDINEQAIRYARDNFAGRYPVEYHRSSADDLSFLADHSVDIVVSFETIEHLEDFDRFLVEAQRILKPDGRIIASVPNLWVDETGQDPNPYHFHAFDYARFRSIMEQHFLPEARYAQAAPGGFRLWDSPRELQRLDLEIPGRDTEWLILVATQDPRNSAGIPYRHPEFDPPGDSTTGWLTDFAGHYDNPWLYRAMVQLGQRISDPAQLEQLCLAVMRESDPASADFGAALTVVGYQVLSRQVTGQYLEVLSLINDYCTIDSSNPHVVRWQISAVFLGGRLCMELGERGEALAWFRGVMDADPCAFSPLLATKSVAAAFWSGVIHLVDGEEVQARTCFQAGIGFARRALHEPDSNAIGHPDHPNTFGFAELAELADMAGQCSNALHWLPRYASSPGLFWQAVDVKRFGLAHWALDLTRENQALRAQLQRMNRPVAAWQSIDDTPVHPSGTDGQRATGTGGC